MEHRHEGAQVYRKEVEMPKITVTYTYKVDGELGDRDIADVFSSWCYNGGLILSEDYDGTSDFAIEIESFEVSGG